MNKNELKTLNNCEFCWKIQSHNSMFNFTKTVKQRIYYVVRFEGNVWLTLHLMTDSKFYHKFRQTTLKWLIFLEKFKFSLKGNHIFMFV